MPSLSEKLQLLFSAKLQDIVNKALQRNPIQVLNEYLRQHEDAYDQVQMDMAVTGGRVKTEQRHVQEEIDIVANLTAQIEAILTDKDKSNDYEAENLSADLVGKEDLLVNGRRTLEAAERAHNALITAKSKLYGRIISLRNQIALLKAIQSEADIKGMTADILIRSARMISSGVTSVDGLAESIKQNRDKADAKFEMALQKLETPGVESLVQSRANDKLDEIRARLGLKTDEAPDATEDLSVDMSPADLKTIAVSQ